MKTLRRFVRRILFRFFIYGRLAQWKSERLITNQEVAGSSPASASIFNYQMTTTAHGATRFGFFEKAHVNGTWSKVQIF